MPGNMIVINGIISYYVGDSKMDDLIKLLDDIGLKQDFDPKHLQQSNSADTKRSAAD